MTITDCSTPPEVLSATDVPASGLTEPEQRDITRLCARTALLLMQHGAESAQVESMARRLGIALGVDQVEIALMASAIVTTTLSDQHCITTARRNEDHGINMHAVIEVQRAVLDVEAGVLDREAFRVRLDAIAPKRYPRRLVAPAVGVACACFARLAGADGLGCLIALLASSIAMVVRLHLAQRHFNPLVGFFVTAFIATSIAAQGLIFRIGTTPKVAMAACVLMLVPGFPMINAVADMVKGYANTGIARLTMAVLLSASTCGGILLASSVWHVWSWL